MPFRFIVVCLFLRLNWETKWNFSLLGTANSERENNAFPDIMYNYIFSRCDVLNHVLEYCRVITKLLVLHSSKYENICTFDMQYFCHLAKQRLFRNISI